MLNRLRLPKVPPPPSLSSPDLGLTPPTPAGPYGATPRTVSPPPLHSCALGPTCAITHKTAPPSPPLGEHPPPTASAKLNPGT